jgi:hypothetical protein
MNLGSKGLGIPLHPREWFWARVLAAVILVGLALLLFLPSLGVPYAATTIVVLPVLAPYLLSKTVVERVAHSVWPVKMLALGGLLVYMKFAKNILAPTVMNWLADLVG